jgi:hypothetical protein
MFNLIRKFKRLFLRKQEGPFEYTAEGFTEARRWAKTQPHPKYPLASVHTLWGYVSGNWIDSEYKLHEINKVKTNKNKSI